MSDLAPFVASVLYDRVLAETKQEVDRLSEQLRKSRAVQIISEHGMVYAEAQFEDGSYRGNPNLWFVRLSKQFALCSLSDFTNVQICIGGSAKADFGANSFVEGYVARVDGVPTYVHGWGHMEFCIGGMGWLILCVGPFASEEAFLSQVARLFIPDGNLIPEDMASFLTQELAENNPELSVTFEYLSFFVEGVKGTIQNLCLDPAIEAEAQRERQELAEESAQRGRAAAAAAAAAENDVDDGNAAEGDIEE